MKIEAGQRRKGLRAGSSSAGGIRRPLPAPSRPGGPGLPVLSRRAALPRRFQQIDPRQQRLHELPRGDHEHREAPRRQGEARPRRLRELPPGDRERIPEQLPLHPGRLPLQRLSPEHPLDQAGQEQKRQARHHREVHRVPRQRRLHGLGPRRGRPEGKPGRGGLLGLPRPSQHPGVPHLTGAIPRRGARVLHPEMQALPRRQRHDEAKQPLG